MKQLTLMISLMLFFSGCAKHLPDCDDSDIKALISQQVLGDKRAPIEFVSFHEATASNDKSLSEYEKACISVITTNDKFEHILNQVRQNEVLFNSKSHLKDSEIRIFLGSEAIRNWLDFIPDTNPRKIEIYEIYVIANLLTTFDFLEDQYKEPEPLRFFVRSDAEMEQFQVEFLDEDLEEADEFFKYRSETLDEFHKLLAKYTQYPDADKIILELGEIKDRVALEQYTQKLAGI
jgi:hypothetical protein